MKGAQPAGAPELLVERARLRQGVRVDDHERVQSRRLVVRLDALKVSLHELFARELPRPEGFVDPCDRGLHDRELAWPIRLLTRPQDRERSDADGESSALLFVGHRMTLWIWCRPRAVLDTVCVVASELSE